MGPREAVLVFDLNTSADWINQADTHSVLRIDRSEQIDSYRAVEERVFSKSYDLTAGELAGALQSGSSDIRGYVAFAGRQPVGIGRLYTHRDSVFGGLYGGGTLVEFRGRGFYRALVAARARDAIAAGSKFLLVDALPTSRPILERLGFQWLTDTWPCEWEPGGA
jgi:hypothetical protein